MRRRDFFRSLAKLAGAGALVTVAPLEVARLLEAAPAGLTGAELENEILRLTCEQVANEVKFGFITCSENLVVGIQRNLPLSGPPKHATEIVDSRCDFVPVSGNPSYLTVSDLSRSRTWSHQGA